VNVSDRQQAFRGLGGASKEKLDEVGERLQAYWSGLSALLYSDAGMSAEQIGKLWWLQIETAMYYMQLGAHHVKTRADHPWLRDDFSAIDERLDAAVSFAVETLGREMSQELST
jgi:hypothetical protein